MKKIIALLLATSLMACNQSKTEIKMHINSPASATELIEADKAFSAMSAEKGMAKAFVQYASDDVVKLRDKQLPILNKEELKKWLGDGGKEDFVLSWVPTKADIAQSGELGYTFGDWVLKTKTGGGKDTLVYGNYVSIWKKQADGAWKYVLDGGNTTPQPAAE
jgi:ketosteroid isomerase-like protein